MIFVFTFVWDKAVPNRAIASPWVAELTPQAYFAIIVGWLFAGGLTGFAAGYFRERSANKT
jgi:hypothetical protein